MLPLLTVADLGALPACLPSGDVRWELDNGRLAIAAPPTWATSTIVTNLVVSLTLFDRRRVHGFALVRPGIILRRKPDRVVVTAAAYCSNHSFPSQCSSEGFLITAPDIVIEVNAQRANSAE